MDGTGRSFEITHEPPRGIATRLVGTPPSRWLRFSAELVLLRAEPLGGASPRDLPDSWSPRTEAVLFRRISGGGPTAGVTLLPELASRLVRCGVRLVGTAGVSIDVPPGGSGPTPLVETSGEALLRSGLVLLEELALDGVAPGLYELDVVAVGVAGERGAPARAALRAISGPSSGAASRTSGSAPPGRPR